MDPRLDPACGGARALTKRHEDQLFLLAEGEDGQLAKVLRETQRRQVQEHLVACAACRHYDPRCAACGFDVARAGHGWMCPKGGAKRWRDFFPWNWRSRHAPPAAKQADWGRVVAKRQQAGAAPASRRAERPVPAGVATRAAAPKPRPRPSPPAPTPLAIAFATLGLAPEAKPEAVRAAYRKRAQEYHPDKVAHMAPEFRAVAESKMTEINAAYERIKRSWAA